MSVDEEAWFREGEDESWDDTIGAPAGPYGCSPWYSVLVACVAVAFIAAVVGLAR